MNVLTLRTELDPKQTLTELHRAFAKRPQPQGLKTEHMFADGIYGRKLFIPAGTAIVSKKHRRECFFFILSGTLSVYRDDGDFADSVEGPAVFIAPASKRLVVAHTDVWCMTTHRLDNPHARDLNEIEAQVIEPESELPLFGPGNILKANEPPLLTESKAV